MPYTVLRDTPIGPLTVIADGSAVTAIRFGALVGIGDLSLTPLLLAAKEELTAYFAGRLCTFSVPVCPQGSVFSRRVWEAVCEIPYGQTVSYGEIAAHIGNPKAARAVGMANHRNPIPIIIPCHRVIGASGKAVGYAGGVALKTTLLNLERENSAL